MCGPLLDWNGNGYIDPTDVAIMLALAEEQELDAALDDASEQDDYADNTDAYWD